MLIIQVAQNDRNALEGLVLRKKAFYLAWSYVELPKPHESTKWKNREPEVKTKLRQGQNKEYTNPFELKEQEFDFEMEDYSFDTAGNIIMMFGLNFTNRCYSIQRDAKSPSAYEER